MSQFGALEAILHLGPLSQRDLSSKLLRSGGDITLVIDNLEKQGWVQRERGLEDRRVKTIRLTEKGRRHISEVFPGQVAAIVAEMRSLSAGEQESLRNLCRKLGLGADSKRGPARKGVKR